MLTRAPESKPVRRLLVTALTVVATLLTIGPATATAATLSPGAFLAGAGETNDVTVTNDGSTYRWVDTGAPITAAGGCLPAGANPPGATITCPAVGFITIDLLDLNDETDFVGAVSANTSQDGGAGDDTLRGSSASFFNFMTGGPGADLLAGGGSANDTAFYFGATDVAVSLDNVANDGAAGEGDNVLDAVENINTAAGNDTVTGSAADNDITTGAGNDVLDAGAGDDGVFGGAGDDSISGGSGDDVIQANEGADVVRGGDGNDDLSPGFTDGPVSDGADDLSGGPGTDRASLDTFGGVSSVVTLDDVPDDGIPGAGDNYHTDIEDISTAGDGGETVIGSAAGNVLRTGAGNDVIDGRAGNDFLSSFEGDDTITSRDGFADRVDCGPGTDTAIVDTLDQVSPNCETVQAADVGNANEDAPPAIAFATPAANALIRGGPSTVTVTASDDRSIARVVLIDDGRVVATDTTAPYSFTYQPAADDVGANTLVAQAVDTGNQVATAIRVVRVDRFTPARVSATVTPSRDRTRPYRFRTRGTVSRPAGVSAAQGCTGTVTVTIKRGGRTISTRRAKLTRTCAYTSTATFGSRRRLGNGRLRITARFGGNAVLKARSSAGRNVRAG